MFKEGTNLNEKGRTFLEVLASVLLEDYRFPLLEISFFMYILGSFVFFYPAAIQNVVIGSEGSVYRDCLDSMREPDVRVS